MNTQPSLHRPLRHPLLAIAFALASQIAPNAHAEDFPCKTWNKGAFGADRTQSSANMDWITGHLSGLDTGARLVAMAHGVPVHDSGHANPVQARTWIDLHCRANPSSDVESAALKYWLEHSYMSTPNR